MRIEIDQGQLVIGARDLGALLGLDPIDVQAKMRAGDITSRFETGAGEDAGRFRLTFFCGGQRIRLTCAHTGDVISTTRVSQGTP